MKVDFSEKDWSPLSIIFKLLPSINWSDFCLTIFHFIQELYIIIELNLPTSMLIMNGISLFKWIWNLYHREVLGSFAGLCSSDSVYFVFSRWRQSVWKSPWLGKTLASTLFQTALGLSMNQGIDKHWVIIVVIILMIMRTMIIIIVIVAGTLHTWQPTSVFFLLQLLSIVLLWRWIYWSKVNFSLTIINLLFNTQYWFINCPYLIKKSWAPPEPDF